MISVRLMGWLASLVGVEKTKQKTPLLEHFLNTLNVLNVQLCIIVVAYLLCFTPFIPSSVIVTIFKGHISIKTFAKNQNCILY